MHIMHLSVECFPVAKVGGLADVVGALPKYQNRLGAEACVVMPWYRKPFVQENEWELVFEGSIQQGPKLYPYEVLQEKEESLGFPLFLIKIPGLLDREDIYCYPDESLQFLAFQHAVLDWLCKKEISPEVLHCHDHHTGLVPFMVEHCPSFSFLKGVKTVGTIHNGEYQGIMDWKMAEFLPPFDAQQGGLLDWNGSINPLAAMIKCCHGFTTVSEGYRQELLEHAQGLEHLILQERDKATGILNGIDSEVWNPETDPMILYPYGIQDSEEGKQKNKEALCEKFHLNKNLPLFAFIGRFATEKGADLLPETISRAVKETFGALNIVVLGSGHAEIELPLRKCAAEFHVNFALDVGYNEALSHQLYAGADFLLMPSRVEPCGLNQMYAMRYGTIPIVRYTGGLKDTVADITSGGSGFNYTYPTADDAVHALKRALHFYQDKEKVDFLRKSIMNLDFSWDISARKYLHLYGLPLKQKHPK